MSETLIAENITGTITAGTYTFAVTDLSAGKTLKMDGGQNSLLKLMRRKYNSGGWEPVFSGGQQVLLHNTNREVMPIYPGTYSVQGEIAGTVTLWTEEI